jgi:hypothetical protein
MTCAYKTDTEISGIEGQGLVSSCWYCCGDTKPRRSLDHNSSSTSAFTYCKISCKVFAHSLYNYKKRMRLSTGLVPSWTECKSVISWAHFPHHASLSREPTFCKSREFIQTLRLGFHSGICSLKLRWAGINRKSDAHCASRQRAVNQGGVRRLNILTRQTERYKCSVIQLFIRSKRLWRWYISTTILFSDIIHRPAFI